MFQTSSTASSDSSIRCCKFYLKRGWCGYGLHCRFSHQLPSNYLHVNEDEINRDQPATNVCTLQQVQPVLDQDPQLVATTEVNCLNISSANYEPTSEVVDAENSKKASKSNSQICRFYKKDLWCPFGDKCKFLHEIPKVEFKRPVKVHTARLSQAHIYNKKLNKHENRKQKTDIPFNWRERRNDTKDEASNSTGKVCQYYLRNICRNGDKCRYLHQNNSTTATCENASVIANSAEEAEKDAASSTLPKARVLCQKPEYFLKDLNEELINELRELEISQMRKRIVKENLTEVEEGKKYLVTLNPTDPDWPYDVTEVKVQISYPNQYPKDMFDIVITCEDNEDLPATLIQHIQNSISQWIIERQQTNKELEKVDLMFRPFLKWFDKNFEDLFTSGLKKTKLNINAKAAGLEFIPFHQLPGYSSNKSQGLDENEKTNEDIEINQQNSSFIENLKLDEPLDENGHFPINSTDILNIIKKGTELKWCNLQLSENIASVICQNLQLTIQCSRCKAHHDIFAAPRRKNLIPCTKCHQTQFVTFRPAMVHQYACIIGYLDLEGCQAFDLPIVDSTFSICCLNCNKQKSTQGIHYGQVWNGWCFSCNNKLEMMVGSFKFQILRQGITSGNSAVNIIKLERKDKKVKDPAIQEGKPLPNNGTCKHYKKSYRWFRFPCCGKAYPCDLCHNEKELEHEMKMANRVICGFCAKEQPFSNKPCSTCSSNMTQSIKGHWEGGKGCRDKVKMSRDDRQKYAGLNKTTAKSVKDRKQDEKLKGGV